MKAEKAEPFTRFVHLASQIVAGEANVLPSQRRDTGEHILGFTLVKDGTGETPLFGIVKPVEHDRVRSIRPIWSNEQATEFDAKNPPSCAT